MQFRKLFLLFCFIWASQIFLFVWGVRFCWYQYLRLVFVHKFIRLCQYFFFPFTSKAVWKFSWKLLKYDNCFTVVLCLFDFFCLSTKWVRDFGGLRSYFGCLLEISEHNFENWKCFKAQDKTVFTFIQKLCDQMAGLPRLYDSACLHSRWFIFRILIISAFFFLTPLDEWEEIRREALLFITPLRRNGRDCSKKPDCAR